jgi:hypothetical protein
MPMGRLRPAFRTKAYSVEKFFAYADGVGAFNLPNVAIAKKRNPVIFS